MSVQFKELTDYNEIQDYVRLHKEIFGLNDKDSYPASYFGMLIRNEHPLGMVIGCYINNKLEGMAVGTSSVFDKSIYIPFAGIKKQYQGGRIAANLFLYFRDKAFDKGFDSIYGIIDPLKANVAKMHTLLGSKFFKTVDFVDDNQLLVKNILFRLNKQTGTEQFSEYYKSDFLINNVKMVNKTGIRHKQILFEIPNNFDYIKLENPEYAKNIRNESNEILSHYLNDNKYIITKCFSHTIEGLKRTFYLLEN